MEREASIAMAKRRREGFRESTLYVRRRGVFLDH